MKPRHDRPGGDEAAFASVEITADGLTDRMLVVQQHMCSAVLEETTSSDPLSQPRRERCWTGLGWA